MTPPSHRARPSRLGTALLFGVSLLAGCSLLGDLDDGYTLIDDNGTGGKAGAGSGTVFLPGQLGGACDEMVECVNEDWECCDKQACSDTCAIPCEEASECPNDTEWGCAHGFCLRTCTTDADCEQDGFACHHECTLCEAKESEGC